MQLTPNRGITPAHQEADLPTRLTGFMKPVNRVTLVNVKLIILLTHRKSATYQRCTWKVNLAPSRPVVKNVVRRPRHLRPRHYQLTLPIPLPPQRHPRLR
jgi:hypothetical protein